MTATLATAALGSSAGALGGCADGSVAIDLRLPPDKLLRPTSMTTVGLVADYADGTRTKTVSTLTGGSFALGELAVDDDATLSVELRDAGNRIVGYGRSQALVSPANGEALTVHIAVRRPMLYVSGNTATSVYDPSRDLTDEHFQQEAGPIGADHVAVSADGQLLVVAAGATITLLDTATHQATGTAIALPGPALQLIAVPASRRVVALTSGAVVTVDLDSGVATIVPQALRLQRLAVAGAGDEATIYGLAGAVAIERSVPMANVDAVTTCVGQSIVYAVRSDGTTSVVIDQRAIADIAGGPGSPSVFAADPCGGAIVRGNPDGSRSQLAAAPAASAITVSAGRVVVVGTQPAGEVDMVPFSARHVLTSVSLAGDDVQTVRLPAIQEAVSSVDDPAHELSNVLKADELTARGLVVLPGGDSIAVLSHAWHEVRALTDGATVFVPGMIVQVDELFVVSATNGAIVQRIRTSCDLRLTDDADVFQRWACADRAPEETPAHGEYVPTDIAGIFGGD